MQFAKDSFYIALRDRLAQLNPSRTMTVNGMTRPGILVNENERPGLQDLLLAAFCLNWGAEWAITAASGQIALHLLECTIEYRVDGTDGSSNADRGRQLTEMDTELRRICLPPIDSRVRLHAIAGGAAGNDDFLDSAEAGGSEKRRQTADAFGYVATLLLSGGAAGMSGNSTIRALMQPDQRRSSRILRAGGPHDGNAERVRSGRGGIVQSG